MRKRNYTFFATILSVCLGIFSTIDSYAQPPNNTCATAIPFTSCNQQFNSFTFGGTKTYNGPTCAIVNTAPDAWFRVAGTGGFIKASLCIGASYDTKIHVFRGSCSNLICVAANDDACGLFSEITWLSSLGATYYIMVSGFGTSSGFFTIKLTNGHENITCNTAAQVTAGGPSYKGSTLCSTYSGEAACSPAPTSSAPDHWFRIPGTGNNIFVTTCNNPGFNTKLSAYEGSCASLNCLTGNAGYCGSGSGSAIQFCTRIGTDYYVAVSGTGNGQGAYTLVVIDDAQAPDISNCPSNVTMDLPIDSCEASISWTPPTIMDDCSVPPELVSSSTHNPGAKFPVGTTTVTYTADDEAGNSSQCNFDITINDKQPPVIGKCLSDIELQTNNNCGALLPDFSGIPIEVANSVSDFSGIQGANGWRYGNFGSTPGDWVNFAELPNFNTTPPDDRWEGTQSSSTPFIDAFGAHPGVDNFAFAVRRWKSNYTGDVTIAGEFNDRNGTSTDGTNIRILLNGNQIYEYLIVPTSVVTYSIDTPIAAGDLLDFIVDPRLNTGFDDTYLTAIIKPNYNINAEDNCPNFTISQDPPSNTVIEDSAEISLILTDLGGNKDTCKFKVTVIPSTTLSGGGSAQCVVLDGETRNFYDINGDLILTLADDPGMGLLSITNVTLQVDDSVQTILDSDSINQPYLQRNWSIDPLFGTGPAIVRFYFSENEIDNLATHPNAIGRYDLFTGGILSNVCLTKYPTGMGPGGAGGTLIPTSDITFTVPNADGVYTMEIEITSFSDFYCHPCNRNNPGAALPVELIHFTATADDQVIRLDWSTALEIDNKGFEIQRSMDAREYARIGWMDGHGNSVERRDYQYVDRELLGNVEYYYRLKQIDYNGKFAFSPIRSAIAVSAEAFAISDFIPNPASGRTHMEVISAADQRIEMRLYDHLGRLVLSKEYDLNRGIDLIELDLTAFHAGTYHAVIITPAKSYSKKLILAK